MSASLFLISIFCHLELNVMLIVSMLLFLTFYEFGIGTISFIHIFETNVDSITGFANQVLFLMIFLTSLFPPTLIFNLRVTGTFILYGTISFLLLIYMTLFVKDTSMRQDISADGEETVHAPKTGKKIVEFTEKQKKELYWPEEYAAKSEKETVGGANL